MRTRRLVDEQVEDGGADPVSRAIALAFDWADDGTLDRATFELIVDEVEVPAWQLDELADAVESSGIRIVGAPVGAEDSGRGDDRRDGLASYYAFLNRAAHRLLTADEEVALAGRIDRGRQAQIDLDGEVDSVVRRDLARLIRDGRRAEEEFQLCNIRLVGSIARSFLPRLGAGVTIEDVLQEGYFGLVRAVEKFDASKGFKFSTYASWWIRQSMERAVANTARTIRVPVHFNEDIRRLWRAEQALVAEGAVATDVALADFLDVTVDKIHELRRADAQPSSLDAPARSAMEMTGLARAEAASAVEDDLDGHSTARALSSLLAGVTERERAVLSLRYGLGDGKPRTLEEVGLEFGVTRERIRQIEAKAFTRLKASPNLEEFRGYAALWLLCHTSS